MLGVGADPEGKRGGGPGTITPSLQASQGAKEVKFWG